MNDKNKKIISECSDMIKKLATGDCQDAEYKEWLKRVKRIIEKVEEKK